MVSFSEPPLPPRLSVQRLVIFPPVAITVIAVPRVAVAPVGIAAVVVAVIVARPPAFHRLRFGHQLRRLR